MELLSSLMSRTRREASFSQLELALRLGVSQRHVSFIERDRARPSRQLLLSWLSEVGAAPSVVNAAMLRAGYAHGSSGSVADDLRGHPERDLLPLLLQAHDPNPAFVFDADWRIVDANASTLFLCSLLMPGLLARSEAALPLDMMEAVIAEDGLYSQMRSPAPAAAALLRQLRSEEWARPSLRAGNDRFERSILDRFGADASSVGAKGAVHGDQHFTFETSAGILQFFRVQMVAGLPQDITPASLRVELWYAVDAHTGNVVANGSVEGIRNQPCL